MEDRKLLSLPGALRIQTCFSPLSPFLYTVFGWVWLLTDLWQRVVGVIALHPSLVPVLRWWDHCSDWDLMASWKLRVRNQMSISVIPIVLHYLGSPISAVLHVPWGWDAPAPSLPWAGRGGGHEPLTEHQDKGKCSSLSISQCTQWKKMPGVGQSLGCAVTGCTSSKTQLN